MMKGNPVSVWIYIIGGIIIAAFMIAAAVDVVNKSNENAGIEETSYVLDRIMEYAKACVNTSFNATMYGPVNITSNGSEICINGECEDTNCNEINATFFLPKGANGDYNITIEVENKTGDVQIWLLTS